MEETVQHKRKTPLFWITATTFFWFFILFFACIITFGVLSMNRDVRNEVGKEVKERFYDEEKVSIVEQIKIDVKKELKDELTAEMKSEIDSKFQEMKNDEKNTATPTVVPTATVIPSPTPEVPAKP